MTETTTDLEQLREEALAAIAATTDLDALDEVRVRFTGRRSLLAAVQKGMGDLAPAERKERGQALNAFKRAFEDAYAERHGELERDALSRRLEAERLDLTLPPRRLRPGRPHLVTQVTDEIVDLFAGLGYRVVDGPEAEAGEYNFDLLNIPADHPARQEMDTIYVAGAGRGGGRDRSGAGRGGGRDRSRADDVVLRTHTSPVQARVMTTESPPIAVVVPGRTYRADTIDATHSPVFTQIEGLYVDEGVTMADLRGTLLLMARALFGEERDIRLRPGFFPFTEPSAEVDVSCGFCGGDGSPCRVCSGTGWIEILGAGMVDPNVLEACGIDPGRWSGFAFGIGIERVAMLRHGVADIRDFFEGDVRFLARF